ncbi:hypothetical protein ILUMI_14479 [Ignelater luminosus]|uniref:Peptidase S1 domain-containing protein n=1 Tax=Ignelater luminosus TaxID=2038154 RepID=A0A8K0CSD2_IGNLU|nr:hypothetical protein ILUMI_14479 [Ignelater luminosus]
MIGGTPADIENYPSMAYLFVEKAAGYDYRGGAAIIGMYWAITAAHCLIFIPDFLIKSKAAFIGSNTSYWENNFVKHQIIKKYVHAQFNKKELDFDIGLVKVHNPFDGIYEKPIKLAVVNYGYNDATAALALGWGTTDPLAYSVVSRLRLAEVKLKNFKICQENYA